MQDDELLYEKSKQRAKEIYRKIGRVPSPALNGDLVAFTSAGFNHLVRKGRISRPKKEQIRRFVLVQYIEHIVRNPHTTIHYERRETRVVVDRHGEKITVKSVASFWSFTEHIDGYSVKVVVRQIGTSGPKHFLSVMGDTVTSKKQSKNQKARNSRGKSVKTKNPPQREDV